jgi:hypothetical protein
MRSKLHLLGPHIFKPKRYGIFKLFFSLFSNMNSHCPIELFREFWGTQYNDLYNKLFPIFLSKLC